MKREPLRRVCATAALCLLVMLLIPLPIRLFMDASQAIGPLILLYYWVNPLFAAGVGVYAGGDMKGRWYLTLIPAALYPPLTWASTGSWDISFFQVAGTYLLIGLALMAFSRVIRRLRKPR